MTNNINKLISLIKKYTQGTITLEDLEDYYVPKLELFVEDPETRDIISQLELGLAELQCKLQTEDELKSTLKDMLKIFSK